MKSFQIDELVLMHPDHMPPGWDRNQIGVILTPPAPFQHTVQWGDKTTMEYAHHMVPYAKPTPPRRFAVGQLTQRCYPELVAELRARLEPA